ncbi:antifungal protein ginkbilobin-2-like [Dioscorea cayenensis subsp. rotundata]|uniref:Antifungal protein ginkbilobin-2-like n=1 Tax=Dioscorea cayennensis subsp. rotundata TaxID=55577 RepID=A0AB40BS89_DIOCR|nr:antifungal protein ginkbilobin-2-like [Dioscorea cayenensis subsp. rotundata]
MAVHTVFIIQAALLLIFSTKTHSQNAPILINCPTTANYTKPSPFATNLALLLTNLTATAANSPTLFSTSFIGSTYGLAQCRPDASSSDCTTCLNPLRFLLLLLLPLRPLRRHPLRPLPSPLLPPPLLLSSGQR